MIEFSLLLGVVALLSSILGQVIAYSVALIMDTVCRAIWRYSGRFLFFHDIVYYTAIVALYAIMIVTPAVSMYVAMT